MTGVTATVEGGAQLQATTRQAVAGLESLDGSEAGRIVSLRASSNAPKLTGVLARSIHATQSGPEVSISTDVEYAAVQEFGGGNNISAQPYMRPALADSQAAIEAAYGREVSKEVSHIHGT